ncbi:hypothetical protein OSTOST_09696, partial [Ostertagia ostertagi]
MEVDEGPITAGDGIKTFVDEVEHTVRQARVAAHSHVKGLGLDPVTREALPNVSSLHVRSRNFILFISCV